MKKLCLVSLTTLTTAFVVLALTAGTAQSRPKYAEEFISKYVKADSSDPAEKKFAEVVGTKNQTCLVCHSPKSKEVRNDFGKAVYEGLKPAKNEKDVKKIDEAIEKAVSMHVDSKDPKSPTFGELIKAGKLPAGPPKDAAPEEKK